MRDNYWHVGAGVGYSFDWASVFADYVAFVGGTDTHDGAALTISVSIPLRFGPRQR
jgi:hypothetical protein